MFKYFIFFAFFSQIVLAANKISNQDFVNKILRANLYLKALAKEQETSLHNYNVNLGKFSPTINISGNIIKDKSIPDISFASQDKLDTEVKLEIKDPSKYGVTPQLFLQHERDKFSNNFLGNSNYDLNKNQIGAGLEIDLTQNLFGRIDRYLSDNWESQYEISLLEIKDKIEIFIVYGLDDFYDWLLLKKQIYIQNIILNNSRKLLNISYQKQKKGINKKREILIYKANLENIKRNIASLNKQFLTVLEDIKYLSGEDFSDSKLSYEYYLSKNDHQIIRRLQEDNYNLSDIRKIEIINKKFTIAKQNMLIAKYKLLPEIKFTSKYIGTGKHHYSKESYNDGVSFNNPIIYAGIDISYPLGKSQTKQNYKKSLSDMHYSKLLQRDLENQIRRDITQLQKNILGLKAELYHSRKYMLQEQEKYENEIKEYKLGKTRASILVDFQNDYLQSQLSYFATLFELKKQLNHYLYVTSSLLAHFKVKL